MLPVTNQGRILGALGAQAPWVTKGAPKKRRNNRKEREKEEKRGTRKRKIDRKVNQGGHDLSRGSRENFRGVKLMGGVRATFFNFAPGCQN